MGMIEEEQVSLLQNPNKIKAELIQEREKRERIEAEYQAKQKYFNDNFKLGSTNVILKEGKFYFWGDVSHCGEENIFHNARRIKELMIEKGMKSAHMNCNDPPTFDKVIDWEIQQKQRKEIYKDELYMFTFGDETKKVETIPDIVIHDPKTCYPNDDEEDDEEQEEE